jgi:hypothetical protein
MSLAKDSRKPLPNYDSGVDSVPESADLRHCVEVIKTLWSKGAKFEELTF